MANFTPQEIEQFLQEFFDVVGTRQYTGARYVPIFGRKGEESIVWDNSAPYEPLTIVLYQGNSYTSRQYVPTGVDISNAEYWANTGNYNSQIELYRQEIANALQEVDDKLEEEHEYFDEQIDLVRMLYSMNGKKVAIFGDSTSRVSLNADGTVGLSTPEYLAQIAGCTCTNYGVNGATICPVSFASNQDQTKSIYWQVMERNNLSEFDFVVIFGGTNDIQGGNDFYSDSYNPRNVRLCVSLIAKRIKEQAPFASLIWVTPYAMLSDPTVMRGINAPAAVNALKCVLSSNSVPCVDMFNCSGVGYDNITQNMQESGNETQHIYVHPFQYLRIRSAYAILKAAYFGVATQPQPQGNAIGGLYSIAKNDGNTWTQNGSIGTKSHAFIPYNKYMVIPSGGTQTIIESVPYTKIGGVISIAGYVLSDNSSLYLEIKPVNSTIWTVIGYHTTLYSDKSNFCITITDEILKSVGLDPTNTAYLDFRFRIGTNRDACTVMALVFSGYYNGNPIVNGNMRLISDPRITSDGNGLYVCTELSNMTTDENGFITNFPSSLSLPIGGSMNFPVTILSSLGAAEVAILGMGANKRLRAYDGTNKASWTGSIFVDISVRAWYG